MATGNQKAVPKLYIPDWLKLPYFNNSNLKTDIQNRISTNISINFYNALNDMKGDTNNGIELSEITLLALAYFYSEIFIDSIKNEFYTLEMVKGFFDGDNLTPYTAIHEIDVEYHKLTYTPLFKECYLIIQSAWFFNSEHFGAHLYIDYINHYVETGTKLPIENYKFDAAYLQKKYNDLDTAKTKIPINGFSLVSSWYYGILFLLCKELNLSTANFKITETDNREYNPLTKTSRELRPLMPFKIAEADIKSAFPTFLDIIVGAKLKDRVYNNLMVSKNINRPKAKILFNTVCNSGKYKSEEFTFDFFIDCGYSSKQAKKLIKVTHNKDRKFVSYMFENEALAIKQFIYQNNISRCGRLHDAVLFIDTKIKPELLKVRPNCDFGYKVINIPVIKESFIQGKKRLQYAYINSMPQGLKLTSKVEFAKPASKGTANGFKFYTHKFEYMSASFNINDYKLDGATFKNECTNMIKTLNYLNAKPISTMQLLLILRHIRQNSNLIFNVRALYNCFKTLRSSQVPDVKSRNYSIVETMNFKKNIEFITARSEAEKLVNIKYNYKELFELLEERITNNDYSFLYEISFVGHKRTNLLSYAIVQKFNLLCTARTRKQRYGLSGEPLYLYPIKGFTLKSLSSPKQQQNAYIQKKIIAYERDIKALSKLVNNRTKANQLIFLLMDIAGIKTNIQLERNNNLIDELKTELLNIIDKENGTNRVQDFNKLYPKVTKHKIDVISDLNNVFDTN